MAIQGMVNVEANNTKSLPKKKTGLIHLLFKKKKGPDFSHFDPDTGEKIANQLRDELVQNNPTGNIRRNPSLSLAKEEAITDARRGQDKPIDWFHALKSGTVGTSGGFVLSQLAHLKGRKAGLLSLGLGTAIGAIDMKKQLGNYNKQMAARELIAGKKTPRSVAYYENLKRKYNL